MWNLSWFTRLLLCTIIMHFLASSINKNFVKLGAVVRTVQSTPFYGPCFRMCLRDRPSLSAFLSSVTHMCRNIYWCCPAHALVPQYPRIMHVTELEVKIQTTSGYWFCLPFLLVDFALISISNTAKYPTLLLCLHQDIIHINRTSQSVWLKSAEFSKPLKVVDNCIYVENHATSSVHEHCNKTRYNICRSGKLPGWQWGGKLQVWANECIFHLQPHTSTWASGSGVNCWQVTSDVHLSTAYFLTMFVS